MKINKIILQNFRNHKKLEVSFTENVSLIVGPNGVGKTNILEAIHLLSTTKSLRAKYDREMISHNESFSRIECKAEIDNHATKLEMIITANQEYQNMSKKIVKLDGVGKSLNFFSGQMPSVLFAPTDIDVITGTPGNRRKYLDTIFFQFDKKYKRAHQNYQKALRQRNKLLETLRETGSGRGLIEIWTEKLIENGAELQNKRTDLFLFFSQKLEEYGQIVNGDKNGLKIVYSKNDLSKANLEKYKEKEVLAARTLIGPHRDDFHVEFNGYDAASFGSRGQQRATLLAIKMCELDFIEFKHGNRPILLLDDIFSELDEKHRKAVLEITDKQQTIVTSVFDVGNGYETVKL